MANTVSLFIRQQLPEFIRNDYDTFVTFVEAYYAWMDQSGKVMDLSKKMPDYFDLDTSLNSFITYFTKQFLPLFPADRVSNPAFFIQHAKEFYRAKGTSNAVKLLFRLLYGQDIDVFYPKESVLKASTSGWTNTPSLRLDPTMWTIQTGDGANVRFRALDTSRGANATVYVNDVLQASGYRHSPNEPYLIFDTAPVANAVIKVTYPGADLIDLFSTNEIVVKMVGQTSGATAISESLQSIIADEVTQLDLRVTKPVGTFTQYEVVKGRWTYNANTSAYIDIYGRLVSYLSSITIVDGGLGYNVGDVVVISGGYPTTPATAVIDAIYSALISNIVVTDGGVGYQAGQLAYIVTGIPYQSRDRGISDNFNRANSASLGGGWIAIDGVTAWNVRSNTAVANDSLTTLANPYADVASANNFSLNTTRQWAEVTIKQLPSTNLAWAGVTLRGTANSNTFWWFVAGKQTNVGLGSDAGSYIEAVIGGVGDTSVRGHRSNTDWQDGDIMRAEADGPNLFLYRNGVLDLYWVDTRIPSGNNAGMYTYAEGIPGNVVSVLDDFSCGNLTSSNGLSVYVNTIDASGNVHPNSYPINQDVLSLWANTAMSDPNFYFSPSISENVNTVMSQAFTDFILGKYPVERVGPISTVTITSSTSVYSTAPTLTLDPPIVVVTGNTANGNVATANVPLDYFGILGRMNVAHGGNNYTVGDEVSFENIPGVGIGIGAAAEVTSVHLANSGIKTVEFRPSRLTGTVNVTTSVSNVEVVGTGTFFTTELLANDRIEINSESSYVSTITNNTHLIVNTAFTRDSTGRNMGVYGRYFIGGMNYRQSSMPIVHVTSTNPFASGANVIAELILSGGAEFSLSSQTQEPVGKIKKIRIINHGYGYQSPPVLDLSGSGNGRANAVAVMLSNLFTVPGRFQTTEGFLSSDQRLESAGYYSNYSYVVRSQTELVKYKNILRDLVHPAGVKLWGEYIIDSEIAGATGLSANIANTYQASV